MSVYANEGFHALAGFAKVVGAIDGSLVPIITPINASVHPPHKTIDRVDPPPVIGRHVPSLFVRFSFVFVAFGQSVHFIFNTNPMDYSPFSPLETISTSLWASLYHHVPVLSVFSHVS